MTPQSMRTFASPYNFSNFAYSVSRLSRYVRTSEHEEFLQAVAETSRERLLLLKKGTNLWRAQLGHDWKEVDIGDDEHEALVDVECPYPPERMKPNADRSTDGRVNPKGIPCLYLSSHTKTAISEIRPWVHSYVSVGLFKTKEALRLIDTSASLSREYIFNENLTDKEKEEIIWTDIDRAFSTPANTHDYNCDYIVTQIISEIFKINGFDGVRYRSFYGGHNYAMFDVDAADLTKCSLFRVNSIEIYFAEQQ